MRTARPVAAAFAGCVLSIAGVPLAEAAGTPSPTAASLPPADVRVTVQDFGEFRIHLDPAGAPDAVAVFLALTAQGAFDGLTFHRIIPDLLIQAGNPATREGAPADLPSAPPWRLPAETSTRSHRRGTVSLAWRGADPASAGMQWFVALSDVPALDGRGTPIGDVVEGMDVVDHIAQISTFRDRSPVRRIVITKMAVEPATAPAPAAKPPVPALAPEAPPDSGVAPGEEDAAPSDSEAIGDGIHPEGRGE